SPSFSRRIVPLFDTMLVHKGEGSGTPNEPHHIPFPEVESSHPTNLSIPLPSIPTAPIPTITQPDTTPIIQYSRRARIAQSSAHLTVADEPASLVRDQDSATIAMSSTLPYDLAQRVTSPAADKGMKLVPLLVQLLQEERARKLWWGLTLQRRRNYKNRLMHKLPEN
nr:hypothetical protein [Tanacetum cinerariifolium]